MIIIGGNDKGQRIVQVERDGQIVSEGVAAVGSLATILAGEVKPANDGGKEMAGPTGFKAWRHNWCGGARCVVCGEEFEQDLAAISITADGKLVGDIGPECLKAGPVEAAARAREFAAVLRQNAAEQDELANWIEAQKDMPGYERLVALEEAVARRRQCQYHCPPARECGDCGDFLKVNADLDEIPF